jgi:ABC-type multidrug transport system ATPase subunit/uncharacterized membrane protein
MVEKAHLQQASLDQQPVEQVVQVAERQELPGETKAPESFRLLGITLEARNISVCRNGKQILDNVSFKVSPGTLTAIIGPNGAGKTTLMRALSGERPESGQVLLNGEDLYDHPEYWLQQIGYVPVDNVLHQHLTLHESLFFIGKLRLPKLAPDELDARIDHLLTQFNFPTSDKRRDRPIGRLSSGERKRANICSELLVDPPLLMLDEPTSNLDPDAERDLMRRLAEYAHTSGQTILVITHTLNTIDVCDEIIFIENSQLGAAGDREAMLADLEQRVAVERDVASEPLGEERSSFYRWAHVFKHFQTREELRKTCARFPISIGNTQAHTIRVVETTPWQHQLRYLLRRYTRVRIGDIRSLALTLGAGISGVLFFILPAETFMKPNDPTEVALGLYQARQSVYVVAMVVTLIGLITSYTEISKEFRIYRHERLKGLSPFAYFLSKWIWLTLAVGILAPILVLFFIVLVYRQPLPDFAVPRIGEEVDWWSTVIRFQIPGLFYAQASWLIFFTLILTCVTSVTLGLLISAVAGEGDQGYLYLSFVAVFIVLFSGLIRNDKLEQLVNTLSFLSTGRWAYEGFASSINIYCWLDSWYFDEFNSAGHVSSIWLALVLYSLICAGLTVFVLRLRDPWYRGGTNILRLVTHHWQTVGVFLSVLVLLFSVTFFLRQQSRDYHSLNYFAQQRYGGDNSYIYANIGRVPDATPLQYWNGKLSQSWCGDRY